MVFLCLQGVSIPDKTEVIEETTDKVEKLFTEQWACGENEQCKRTDKSSIRSLDMVLETAKMQNNIRMALFWIG